MHSTKKLKKLNRKIVATMVFVVFVAWQSAAYAGPIVAGLI